MPAADTAWSNPARSRWSVFRYSDRERACSMTARFRASLVADMYTSLIERLGASDSGGGTPSA